MVGGQEDMIVDVALDLAAAAGGGVAVTAVGRVGAGRPVGHGGPTSAGRFRSSPPRRGWTPTRAYACRPRWWRGGWTRGERLVGLKMGLTSRAKMAQMGVDEVIWGRLTDAMRIPDGATVATWPPTSTRGSSRRWRSWLDRAPEPGEPVADFAASVRAVAPAIELIDSRYANFSFSLPDVIADNTSAAGFVVGAWSPVPDGLENLGVLLEVDGRVAQVGSTAAILGDPRRALAEGVRLAGRHGVRLRAGLGLPGRRRHRGRRADSRRTRARHVQGLGRCR